MSPSPSMRALRPLDNRFARLSGWERLAVVLSVLWCICVLIATWDNRIGSHYSILGFSIRWNRLVMASIALAPVLLWIALISGRWVAQGFRESSRSRMVTAGQVQASAPLVVATPHPAATNSASNVAVADGKIGTLRVWVVSLGVLLVLAYAGLFIPAFAGHRPMPQAGSASTTSTALFFYLLWRLRNKRGWHGALIGACAGLVAFFCAGFISGFVSHS